MVEPVGPVDAGPYPAVPDAKGYSLAGDEGAEAGRGRWVEAGRGCLGVDSVPRLRALCEAGRWRPVEAVSV